ncbi:unnamed protein product, partial [Hapterophycus canaliculatus]
GEEGVDSVEEIVVGEDGVYSPSVGEAVPLPELTGSAASLVEMQGEQAPREHHDEEHVSTSSRKREFHLLRAPDDGRGFLPWRSLGFCRRLAATTFPEQLPCLSA